MNPDFIVVYMGRDRRWKIRTLTDGVFSSELLEFSSGYGVYVNNAIAMTHDLRVDKSRIVHIFEPLEDKEVFKYYFMRNDPVWPLFYNTLGIRLSTLANCIVKAIDHHWENQPTGNEMFYM